MTLITKIKIILVIRMNKVKTHSFIKGTIAIGTIKHTIVNKITNHFK